MRSKFWFTSAFFTVCALSAAQGADDLLQSRAGNALASMQRSMTTVTMATAEQINEDPTDPDEEEEPDYVTTGTIECGYTSEPGAEICYMPTSTAAGCPPDEEEDDEYVTTGTIECGYTSDPAAEICYMPTSIEAGCPPPPPTSAAAGCPPATSIAAGCPAPTSLAAGCPKFTEATGCNFTEGSGCAMNTYPVACGSHTVDASGYFTCSSGCSITSTPPQQGCTGSPTYNPSCVWTYRPSGDCSTSSQWCNTNTYANNSNCSTKASGNCDHKSWNISCITTFGGSDCTNSGGCLATTGLNCQQTSGGSVNVCGTKTSAPSGSSVGSDACATDEDEEEEEDDSGSTGSGTGGTGGLLAFAIMGTAVLAGFRGRADA